LLFYDGSTHEWGLGFRRDVIVTLDDATLSRLRGLQEVMETQGFFSSLYTDRVSHCNLLSTDGG